MRMATFIAIVKRDGDAGYTASFPDFPSCAVAAQTIDRVIARAKEALSLHIERLLEANHRICDPTAADVIERGDALLLAAVEVPDNLRIAHVDLAIPALSLARIDAFARRHGLTHATLFVEAVNRWAMQETAAPRDRRHRPRTARRCLISPIRSNCGSSRSQRQSRRRTMQQRANAS